MKLLGPSFLEKASKKLDTDKALAKVSAPPLNPRKWTCPEEQTDLRSFCPRAPTAHTAAGDSSTRESRTTTSSIPTTASSTTTNSISQGSHPIKSDSSSPWRESTILPASLAPGHLRSQGAGSGEGLPARAGTDTPPDWPSAIKGKLSEGMVGNQYRNQNSESKAGHSCSTTMYRPIHQQTVCDTEERWLTTPCD